MGSRGLVPLRGVLKGGGAAPFFFLAIALFLFYPSATSLVNLPSMFT